MDALTLLKQQLKDAHGLLDATMQGVTPQHAHWLPGGKANPISASYAHVVLSEDFVVNGMLKGAPPLCATNWAGKVGLSEMPPPGPMANWFDWGRKVKVDLAAMKKYSEAVYANTESYLATLKDADLSRKIATPAGEQTVAWVLSNVLVGHIHDFTGEISCMKGMQGMKGYPF